LREDADGFDGVTAGEGPSSFFRATVLVPDLVDRDRDGLFALVFDVAFIPFFEPVGSLDGCFAAVGLEGVHRLKIVAAIKRMQTRMSSTGWRSCRDFIVHDRCEMIV
jgi:hypothetical protein